MISRLATDDDFRAFFGREPPEAWFGLLAEDGGEILGIGTVAWRWDYRGIEPRLRAWAAFDGRHKLPSITMHRTAVKTLDFLRREGELAIHALCDHRIPGAEAWLRRLGFSPDAAMTINYGEGVWSRRFDG